MALTSRSESPPQPSTTVPATVSKAGAAAVVFAVLAAVFLAWPIYRLWLPLEVNRNEPWAAWFADAILQGKPLYPAAGELIVNNYPPLSYYLTAGVSLLTGDTIVAGRLIALASAFLFSFSAGLCIRALGGSRAAAAFGGFWLLATLARFFSNYVGVNDPSLLSIAVMSLGLAAFLDAMRRGRAVEPGIALMVLGGFVKHNMPAIPLAALIWLAMHDRRLALRAALFGAALCGTGLFICYAVFGGNFFVDLLMPREMRFGHIFMSANRLQWIVPALVFWGLWVWRNGSAPAVRFTALLLGLTLINGLLQAAGAGVTYNAYFGAVLATAIGAALAFEGLAGSAVAQRYSLSFMQNAMIAVLLIRLLASQQLESFMVLASPSFREEVRQHTALMTSEIHRVAQIPGPVVTWPLTVAYRAGKDFVYDQYWAGQFLAAGLWTQEQMDRALRDRAIRFEPVDSRVSVEKKRAF